MFKRSVECQHVYQCSAQQALNSSWKRGTKFAAVQETIKPWTNTYTCFFSLVIFSLKSMGQRFNYRDHWAAAVWAHAGAFTQLFSRINAIQVKHHAVPAQEDIQHSIF